MKLFFIIAILFFTLYKTYPQKKIDFVFIDSVFNYICEKNIQYADIVIKQSILETGWMRGKFLMLKNNLFGFKNRKHYLKFNNWKESVDFYKGWQDRNYKNNEESYYKFLRRIKYGRKYYISLLKKIKYDRVCIN